MNYYMKNREIKVRLVKEVDFELFLKRKLLVLKKNKTKKSVSNFFMCIK